MLPLSVQENIFKIINIFKNYEYMKKSIEELEDIEVIINETINHLHYFKNRPLVQLAFEHRKHIKNQEKFLESNIATMVKEIYENCYYLKDKFNEFLIKLKMRVETLKIGKITFSEKENDNFYSQLLNFIEQNQIDLLEQLLNQNLIDFSYSGQFNAINQNRVSELMNNACKKNNLAAIKMFYNSNARINNTIASNPIQGSTLFWIALSNKEFNVELIRYLLDNGINNDIFNNPQRSPLHFLVKKISENKINEIKEILELFFQKGANANFRNQFGETALESLIIWLDTDKSLFPVTTNDGTIYIYYIDKIAFKITLKSIKIVIDLFIANNFDINLQDQRGNTILHQCFFSTTNIDIIKYLLNHRPNVYITNNRGNTALQYAKQSGDIEKFKLISNYAKK